MSSYARGEFSQSKRRSPVSLGAALAINGAVVGALLFANPEVVKKIPTTIDLINIPIDTPPDPVKQPKPPKAEPKGVQAQDNQIAISRSPAPSDDHYILPPRQPDPPFTPGTGDSTNTIQPPPHVPVFVGAQVNPRYANALQPAYPPGMIRAEKEGKVTVRVRIGADGRVKEVQMIEAADDAFYRATVDQAMRRWRFTPATRDGVAEESWKVMTLRFELDTL